ncbi:MAG: hypothetical protein WBD20_14320 [Pirellulaceae bacterium]
MNDSNSPPLNPYAPTFEDPDPTAPKETFGGSVVGAGEIIGNGILGVGVSGAVMGFVGGLAAILWNLQSIEPTMIMMPLLGIVVGFSCGSAAGMPIVPIVYGLFTAAFVESDGWTPDKIIRFAAFSGFLSCFVASLLVSLIVGPVAILFGAIAGMLAAYVTARVLLPLRKLVAKRLAAKVAAEDSDPLN